MKSILKENLSIKTMLFWVIVLSALVRIILAWTIDLGASEAYYWTYGKFPALSHMDHPPMIGWFIQLFTVNLAFDGEFFLRLASIVVGSINTWIVFIIGRRIKNDRTGLYASMLYTASLYCSLFIGTFISPDTPQSLFILLSIYFLHEGIVVKYETCDEVRTLCRLALVLAGIFLGLAMLSKYSSFLIWVGALVYIVSSNRKLLKEPYLYIALLISAIFMFPVIIWNIETNFISFEFQSSRLLLQDFEFNFTRFALSIADILIYNNLITVAIIIFAVFNFKKKLFLTASQYKLLISLSLPFLIFFLAISIFTDVKPNWSAPGFFPLMFIAAAYLENSGCKNKNNTRQIPFSLSTALSFLVLTLIIILIHQFSGILTTNVKRDKDERLGNQDFTLDYVGWKTLSSEFQKIRESDLNNESMPEKSFILSSDWANAAHSDFYLASPNKIVVKTIGKIEDTRKYAWITGDRGTFRYGESAYYIESSREIPKAEKLGEKYFTDYKKLRSVYIKKFGKPVLRFDIYRFRNLKTIPDRELCSYTKY